MTDNVGKWLYNYISDPRNRCKKSTFEMAILFLFYKYIPDKLKDTSTIFHLSILRSRNRQNFCIVNFLIGRIRIFIRVGIVKIIKDTFASGDIETLAISGEICDAHPFTPVKSHPWIWLNATNTKKHRGHSGAFATPFLTTCYYTSGFDKIVSTTTTILSQSTCSFGTPYPMLINSNNVQCLCMYLKK